MQNELESQLQALVPELLAAEPSARAVMLFGSHSHGTIRAYLERER